MTPRGTPDPRISSTTLFQRTLTLARPASRSHRIFSARNEFAPVHHRDFGGDVGKVERFLDGGIAAADDDDRLLAKEESVASRAGRNAEALECVLARQAEPLRLRPGRQNDRLRSDGTAAVAADAEGPLPEFERHDGVVFDAGADMFGLRAHLLHEPGALDRLGEARIILDVGGDHELTARLEPRQHQRPEKRASRIDGGGVAGRSRTDDDHALVREMGRTQDETPFLQPLRSMPARGGARSTALIWGARMGYNGGAC